MGRIQQAEAKKPLVLFVVNIENPASFVVTQAINRATIEGTTLLLIKTWHFLESFCLRKLVSLTCKDDITRRLLGA